MVFGKFGDMVKQARELQSNLKKIKEELERSKYEAESGGVKVVVSGSMEISDIQISQNVNLNKVNSIVKDAANQALKKAKDDASEKLKKATGGMSLPGLM